MVRWWGVGVLLMMLTLAWGAPGAVSEDAATTAPGAALPAVKIASHRGAPALWIEGRPVFGLFHFSQEVGEDYARRFTQAGFELFSFIERTSYLDLGWTGPGEFDFSTVDRVMNTAAERMPQGYYLPRVHVWAPAWWIEQHPEEAMGYATQPPDKTSWVQGGPLHESFASQLWRREAGEGVRRLVLHMMAQPYARGLIGVHLCNAAGGEWHPFLSENLPDTSAPMTRAFRAWLREKYHGDVEALRAAWGQGEVSFENAAIPGAQARKRPDVGVFLDPAARQQTIDYYEAYHRTTVEAIDFFNRIVKQESGGRLLTCANYAYMPDMPYLPSEVDHRAGAMAHRLDSVDMFTSPHSYWDRGVGDDGELRTFDGSLKLHGKFFIDEADDRTHLAAPGLFTLAGNLWESRQTLRRSFAVAATHSVGMWFMDHTSGTWYDDPAFFEDFTLFARWARAAMDHPRGRVSQVAVIGSTRSEFYIGAASQLSAQFWVSQVEELARAGAPFDRFTIEDLEQGLLGDQYKVYLFLDCFYLSRAQRRAVEALKSDGRTLVWFFAPGFVTGEALSADAMTSLTGIDFDPQLQAFDEIALTPGRFEQAPPAYRAWQKNFGALEQLSPRFVPVTKDKDAPALEVWGCYADGQPGLVMREFENWRSVYSPTARLPWAVLNEIYQHAGVHLYARQGDCLSANASMISLHATSAGRKHVSLPSPSPVYDVFEDKLISPGADHFEVDLSPGQTALFALWGKPE